jgi:hypothetical protein
MRARRSGVSRSRRCRTPIEPAGRASLASVARPIGAWRSRPPERLVHDTATASMALSRSQDRLPCAPTTVARDAGSNRCRSPEDRTR